jgi:hypothetical protein
MTSNPPFISTSISLAPSSAPSCEHQAKSRLISEYFQQILGNSLVIRRPHLRRIREFANYVADTPRSVRWIKCFLSAVLQRFRLKNFAPNQTPPMASALGMPKPIKGAGALRTQLTALLQGVVD